LAYIPIFSFLPPDLRVKRYFRSHLVHHILVFGTSAICQDLLIDDSRKFYLFPTPFIVLSCVTASGSFWNDGVVFARNREKSPVLWKEFSFNAFNGEGASFRSGLSMWVLASRPQENFLKWTSCLTHQTGRRLNWQAGVCSRPLVFTSCIGCEG